MADESAPPSSGNPKPAKPEPLEKRLARLEAIVEKLESGEVALEKSIDLYEEGRTLAAGCLEALEALEQRVRLVKGEGADGTLETEDFHESD
jgi:exodeoxyribonuclease VII small subunit